MVVGIYFALKSCFGWQDLIFAFIYFGLSEKPFVFIFQRYFFLAKMRCCIMVCIWYVLYVCLFLRFFYYYFHCIGNRHTHSNSPTIDAQVFKSKIRNKKYFGIQSQKHVHNFWQIFLAEFITAYWHLEIVITM